jgi:tRNA pseudouridine38-40 synthase
MKRYTYRLELAYDGGPFCGFAKQQNQVTVEGEILKALSPHIENIPSVAVGGRTDKGVNASAQVISFWSHEAYETGFIRELIDSASPRIFVQDVRLVSRSFHARYSAGGRRYVYFHPQMNVSLKLINRMFLALLGRRCFSAFARDTPRAKSCVRSLWDARVRVSLFEGQEMLRFDFAADGFLRRQIRILVATALREATNGGDEHALLAIAQSQDRRMSAQPAEAGGLYLAKILYPPIS